MMDLFANFVSDALNKVYKSFQTDKRKGIKTELKPIVQKVMRRVGRELNIHVNRKL
jgi:hypothetical protein